MPEAEDVILDGAERATAAARDLWRRRHPAGEPPGLAVSAVRERLGALTRACFGREWPILPSDPASRPSWLARRSGRYLPGEPRPVAEAFTDGARIFLPRRIHLAAGNRAELEIFRLTALSLAGRLTRGSLRWLPRSSPARHLFWAAEGHVVDRLLANELPGLRSSLGEIRRTALRARPGLAPLSPRERFVENAIRRLLEDRLDGNTPPLDGFPPGVPEVARVAEWACGAEHAAPRSPYRGVVTVPHWGCARPDLAAARRQGGTYDASVPAPGESRSRMLSRRVEPRDVDEAVMDERQGPFLIPFGDPQQSIQDPSGLRRPEDRGADVDLDALADQMERLDRLARIRSATAVREVVEAEEDRRAGTPAAPSREDDRSAVAYPEWDYRTGAYQAGRCRLQERSAPAGDASWSAMTLAQHRGLLTDLKRRFEAFRPRRSRIRREREGAELDLDAYVEDFADRLAGRGPSERLYVCERALRRDVSVAFLIDASGSTESWVGAGRRVIDVEKEAALVLCEALETLRDRYALYAFSGRGAAGVRVLRLKSFAEAYGEDVRGRIAGVHSDAFTRIGGPLRHVTALLARERSRLRLLFLLSDGKPNDVDEYEGDYGIEDTRQAIAEARLQGVEVFCLTVDREGSTYLPRMFGPGGFGMITNVSHLPERLPEIYRRITSSR